MKRRWRWVAVGILLLATVVVGVATRAIHRAGAELVAPASARILHRPVTVGAVPAAASEAAAPWPLAVPDTAKPVQAAASSPYVDVCGHGRVLRSELEKREEPSPPAWAAALDRQLQQAQAQVLERLDGGSTRQRVAAALLSGSVQAAAQLAAQTTDATAYQLALGACRGDTSYRSVVSAQRAGAAPSAASGAPLAELSPPGPVPTACAALTLERLEMLRPEDAWSVLARLSDARNRGDEAAIGQALYQLANRSFRARNARPLSEVLTEAIGAEPTMGESLMLMTATGMDVMTSMDGSSVAVVQSCRPPQLDDANRRQLCEQVARRLPNLATELLDARMLHALEERLSIQHSPKAISKEELARLREAMAEGSMAWVDEPTCANFTLAGQQIAALARRGELAYARGRLQERAAASASR